MARDISWQFSMVFANDKHLLSPGNLSEVGDQSSKQGLEHATWLRSTVTGKVIDIRAQKREDKN